MNEIYDMPEYLQIQKKTIKKIFDEIQLKRINGATDVELDSLYDKAKNLQVQYYKDTIEYYLKFNV